MSRSTERPPRRIVVRVIEMAALVLPPGDVRRRYEREFFAELHGLDGRQQARYARWACWRPCGRCEPPSPPRTTRYWRLRWATWTYAACSCAGSTCTITGSAASPRTEGATPTAPCAARSSASTSVLPARRPPGLLRDEGRCHPRSCFRNGRRDSLVDLHRCPSLEQDLDRA